MMGGKGGGVPQGFNPQMDQAMQMQTPYNVMPMQNMQMPGMQMGGPPSMMLPPTNPEIQMPQFPQAPQGGSPRGIYRRPAPALPMGLMGFMR
jgi:hypothetical protein